MTNQSVKGPRGQRERRWGSLFAWILCLWPVMLASQIYRYQDSQGSWHFTDSPPDGYESSVVPGISTSKSPSYEAEATDNLERYLHSLYSPITPIAYATLAVVSIKSDLGEGSGFFCSEHGHILTNKHVVRPEATPAVDEQGQSIEQGERRLESIAMDLKEARSKLRNIKKDLKGYEDLIGNARDEATRSWARDAHGRLSKHYQSERSRISAMERAIRTTKTELRASRHEQRREHSLSSAKTRFDIVLKDGTELVARLEKVSDDQDLALLKLDGYRTPFLRLDPSQPLSQGVRVFAIGNPLGMQDAVTSGVVTRIDPEYLLTDASILPGSSGGPLIRESGDVIGINVSRKVAAGTPKYAAGLGKVIPIAVAVQEFPDVFTASGSAGFDAFQTGLAGPNAVGTTGSQQTAGAGADQEEGVSLSAGDLASGQASGPTSPGNYDSASSPPVRLILPEEEGDLASDKPAASEARSLDFPPEGSAIPARNALPQN